MKDDDMIISYPDPEEIARANGKPDNISLELWNLMGYAGVQEVPKGMNNRQFAEYLNQKHRENHPNRKIDLLRPEDY